MNQKYVLFLFSFVLVLWGACPVRAQQFHSVRLWGVDDGLPDRNIQCIAGDKDGLIWLGTEKGLIRFDGRGFVSFAQLDSGHALAVNGINEMCYAAPYLWIATEKGVFTLNTVTYKTERIVLPGTYSRAHNRNIRVIRRLRNRKIAIGGSDGNLWIATSPNEIKQVVIPYIRTGTDHITHITDDERNNIWVATTGNQVLCFTQPEHRFIYHHRFDLYILSIFRNVPSGHLIKSVSGIYRLDTATNKLTPLSSPLFRNAGSVGITVDSDSTFLAHWRGKELYRYTPAGLTSFSYVFDKIGDQNFHIKTIYRARDYLWIATNYGLIKISVSNQTIPHYFHSVNALSQERSVRGMCEDQEHNLYFACYKGLFTIPYPHRPDRLTPLILDSVSDLVPYALASDPGVLWVGSEGGGLVRYDLAKTTFRRFPEGKMKYKQKFIISVYNDKEKNEIVAGSYQGVSRFNKKTLRFSEVALYYKGMHYNDAVFYQVDKIGNAYWFCTSKGLLKCDLNFVPLRHYLFNGRPVYCMRYDSLRNLVWAGTRGDGLYAISLHDDAQWNYTYKDGLPDNNIVSLALDSNRLWIGTYNGLSRLDIESRNFTNLHTQEGLSHNEFNHGAVYTTSAGDIFMGGLNGYNLVNSLAHVTEEQKSLPFISSLYMLNGKTEVRDFNCRNIPELFIPNNNKVIEFVFGLTDYTQPEKNVYAYKMDGIDQDWVYLGNRNYLRLTELKAGMYNLHVKAAGSNGKWNVMPYALHITVDEHFYFKWWFILAVAGLVVSGIMLYYRTRISQVERLYNLRLQISSDLHDEVGSILTAVGMQAELLQHAPAAQSHDQLKQISDTSRQAVSNMRDVVWSIDSRNDKLKDLIDRMNEYLALLFENSATTYEFLNQNDSKKDALDLVTRQNTYLIFKEAVNNIARHSDATWIVVELVLTDRHMKLQIVNNGNPTGTYKPGMGLKNMEMRARKMKGEFMIDAAQHYNVTLIQRF